MTGSEIEKFREIRGFGRGEGEILPLEKGRRHCHLRPLGRQNYHAQSV